MRSSFDGFIFESREFSYLFIYDRFAIGKEIKKKLTFSITNV